MYLRKLWDTSKWWFVAVAAFIVIQLLVNLKKGMVLSPFYHYGMYSEVMHPREAYRVFEITADSAVLRAGDFTPQQWDRIVQPLIYFNRQQRWNTAMYAEMNRICGLEHPQRYIMDLPKREFYKKYQGYLGTILGRDITTLTVDQKLYTPGR